MNVLANLDTLSYSGESSYIYDNHVVPRVTEILSAMLHEQYLMDWANSMGLYKHLKYQDILTEAADIGTATHKAIELYLSEGKELDESALPNNMSYAVHFAFNSFLEWWIIIKKTDYEIIYQEHTLICRYFGGTLDLFIKINGKKYIVDFKTSNHSSYKHFLQLSAYRYMLEEEGENVDGVIILMLDKKLSKFTEYVLDFEVPEHLSFIDKCEEAFLSLVYAFYNRIHVQHLFEEIFGGRSNEKRNNYRQTLFSRKENIRA